jgi:hypothetical protein
VRFTVLVLVLLLELIVMIFGVLMLVLVECGINGNADARQHSSSLC